jgi:peptidoglycan/LPS O-acetylase OafA/YrhL
MLSPKHRISYIDGLRAVAVLLVLAAHAFQNSTVVRRFALGTEGVDLFFVLSGFCLSYPTLAKLYSRGDADFDVVKYAARRVVRIVPPYWIAILLCLGAATIGLNLPTLIPRSVSPLEVVQQAFFLDQGVNLINGPFWTLIVEFRWYFVFPIALWLWTRSPKAFFLIIALFIVASQQTRLSNADLVVLPGFLFGIVAAHVRLCGHRLERFAILAFPLLVAAACLKTPNGESILWSSAMFSLVIAAGATSGIKTLLSAKFLTVIGLASYSIYLVHLPVMWFADSHAFPTEAGIAIAIAAGFIFWYVAERPFVETSVRTKLLSEFDIVFAKWLPRLGIPASFRLEHSVVAREPATNPDAHRFEGDLRHANLRSIAD